MSYFPLLILPLSGLAILVAVWVILAFDHRRDQYQTPAK